MSETMEIYFSDFTPEAQKRILEFYGLEKPDDMNWDVFPFDIIEKGESDEEMS